MDIDGLREQLRERLEILLDLQPETIHDDSSFADLGVDSMMRLELVSMVEQRVGFELPEQDLPDLRTIDLILEYVSHLEAL